MSDLSTQQNNSAALAGGSGGGGGHASPGAGKKFDQMMHMALPMATAATLNVLKVPDFGSLVMPKLAQLGQAVVSLEKPITLVANLASTASKVSSAGASFAGLIKFVAKLIGK